MAGVTNRLIEAAKKSATGDLGAGQELVDTLRKQHTSAADALISDDNKRTGLIAEMETVLAEVANLCRGTALLRELTPRALDAISSSGERLTARLVASSLRERGMKGVAVDATEVIVTDRTPGQAVPLMIETRERAAARLKPLLDSGAVAVVTGFIGATPEGMLTTLGRGGSDYSATILGAVLDARRGNYMDGCPWEC